MKKILISEIGNNHCGDFTKAKKMIWQSKESGADLVKLQAIDPDEMIGSMPNEFYQQCAMTMSEYENLVVYGEEIGIDVFYSIFSDKFKLLNYVTKWNKIAAGQFASDILFQENNFDHTFISINDRAIETYKQCKTLDRARVMFATPYLEPSPDLEGIRRVEKFTKNFNVGLSDHSIGVHSCLKAINLYKIKLIEKHFVLDEDKNNISFKDKIFRDSVHAATPSELESIARELHR